MKVGNSTVYSPNTVHEMGYRGEGMTIAVLDLGIDNDHPVLEGSFVAGVDFTLPDSPLSPRDGTFDPDDKGGHGTGVACVLASRGDENGRNMGIVPEAGIIDLKMSDYNPAYIRAMAEAMEWCLDNRDTDWGDGHVGIDVISMSALTVLDPDGSIAQLLEVIDNEGIPFVQAAGNDAVQHGEDPATYFWSDHVITTGGLDDRRTVDRSDDIYWSGATYGPRTSDGDEDPYDELRPDVVATAVNLTVAAHSDTNAPPSGWRVVEGTSYATPHVSGVVALILQANPDIANIGGTRVLETIRQILRETAEARGEPYDPELSDKYNVRYGFGILDGYEAVTLALEMRSENSKPVINSLSADPEILEPGATSTIVIDAVDPDGDTLSYKVDASGGEISGEGPQWSWTAPMTEGEYSINVSVADQLGAEVSEGITLVVREEELENSDPVIRSFVSSKNILLVEEKADLEVDAFDPDGDEVFIEYETTDGKIIGSGNRVEFRAPDVEGQVTITVYATDGIGGQAESSLLIDVVQPPEIEPPQIVKGDMSPISIERGDRNSKVLIEILVKEETYPISSVFADLTGIDKQQRKSLRYDGLTDHEGLMLHAYSLELRNLYELEAGNHTIIITAEDERNYISDPLELMIMVVTPASQENVTGVKDEGSILAPWMLIPIVILLMIIAASIFLVVWKAGSKRSGSSSMPLQTRSISYQAIEVT